MNDFVETWEPWYDSFIACLWNQRNAEYIFLLFSLFAMKWQRQDNHHICDFESIQYESLLFTRKVHLPQFSCVLEVSKLR